MKSQYPQLASPMNLISKCMKNKDKIATNRKTIATAKVPTAAS